MPEGDTLHRTADVLAACLAGRTVSTARGRPGGAALERTVGRRIVRVEAVGKHLLIDFEGGLTLRTHLRMHGAWHRYRPGEPWRRAASRAVAVLEVAGCVAVCFDAPTVELLDDRALAIHPALARLGPDLLADDPDIEVAVARLRTPERASLTVAEGLLDQSAVAGIGNFHRSEVLWQAAVSPFLRVGEVSDATLRVLLETGIRLLRAGRQGTRPRNVYGRTGRQCPRCGAVIASRHLGRPPRLVFWCPSCQS